MSQIGSVLIVGANRGIGLQLVKEVQNTLKPRRIFATYRNVQKSKELMEMAENSSVLKLVRMDAEDETRFPEIVQQIQEDTNGGLNILICNAGISEDEPQSMELINKKVLMRHFEINSVVPAILAKAFLPLLKEASSVASSQPMGIQRALIVNISSQMGSFGNYDMTAQRASKLPFYAYRTSKAALNMFTRALSQDLEGTGILTVAIHPGSVQTELGFPEAPLTASESAEGIIRVISSLTEDDHGKFLQFDGQSLPW